MSRIFAGFVILSLALAGCSAATRNHPVAPGATVTRTESRRDVESALTGVVGAVRGQPVSQQELRDLARKAEHDEETRSALEKISTAVSGGEPGYVKYCPVCGRRYSGKFDTCSFDGVALKPVE